MPSEKPILPVQSERKQKFSGKLTKWEKKRIIRKLSRQALLKRPAIEPLVIATAQERNSAFKRNKMVFYDGKEKLEIPIRTPGKNDSLLGTYMLKELGKPTVYFSFRINTETIPFSININLLEKRKEALCEKKYLGFAQIGSDLAHMRIEGPYRGTRLALNAVSKTERNAREKNYGYHIQEFNLYHPGFEEVIKKLGYKTLDETRNSFLERLLISKCGKFQPKDNLSKYIRIEAIDPKTGKAKLFTFPLRTPI